MPLYKGRCAPQNTFLETLGQKFDGNISNFVLGNAQSNRDYPIVYCSDGFCALTGFSRSELMSKSCSCNFLYGMDTEREQCQKIRSALQSQVELKVEILFYKRNGSPFWCLLDILPIKNEKGDVVLFLVSHKDITKTKVHDFDIEESTSADTGNGIPANEISAPKFRKFSRDVLFHLQRQYQGIRSPPSRPKKFANGGHASVSGASFLPQYKLENTKVPKYMLLHFGRARLIWDWIILILVSYIAVMVPFNVAFKAHDRFADLIVADVVLELIFISDIIINFRTTYIDKKSGRIVTQQKKIAMHYLKGWFVIDFLPALPFEALYFINHSWGFLVSFLKTGRLLRLFRVARRINRYTEYTAALLGLLMFSFALLAHWFACIWYVIGYQELKDGVEVGWLHELGLQMGYNRSHGSSQGPTYGEAYVSAFYFILTSLTTVGFGNIAPNTSGEKIFSVIVLLLGALMQSAIFGNMTAVIQKLYAVRARFHARATEVKQFVKLHRIEGDLRRRIEDFFLTHWSVSKGVDTNEMLASFPVELRADICLHLYRNFLTLNCFDTASRGCLRAISLKVRRAYFGPGELILKETDAINCVFFVNSGSIEIVQKECIVAILGSGDLFGEDISKTSPINRSNGDVRALTYCDLLYLTRDHFHEVLYFYPDFGDQFSHRLEMTFNLGQKEREISMIYGNLDSITEDDEEAEIEEEEYCEDTSSDSEDDNNEDSSLIGPSSSRGSAGYQLPLWQRKLRRMETSPEGAFAQSSIDSSALEKKLQQIESSSGTELDDDNPNASESEERPRISCNRLNEQSGEFGCRQEVKADVRPSLANNMETSVDCFGERGSNSSSSTENIDGKDPVSTQNTGQCSLNLIQNPYSESLRVPHNSEMSMDNNSKSNEVDVSSTQLGQRSRQRRTSALPPSALPPSFTTMSCITGLDDGGRQYDSNFKRRTSTNYLQSAPLILNRSEENTLVGQATYNFNNCEDANVKNVDPSTGMPNGETNNRSLPCLSDDHDLDSISTKSRNLSKDESVSNFAEKYSLSPVDLSDFKCHELSSERTSTTSLNLPAGMADSSNFTNLRFGSISDSISADLAWDTFHCPHEVDNHDDEEKDQSELPLNKSLQANALDTQSSGVTTMTENSTGVDSSGDRPVSTHLSDSGASFSENKVRPRRSHTFHVHEKNRKIPKAVCGRRKSAWACLESQAVKKHSTEYASHSSVISLSPTEISEANSDLFRKVECTHNAVENIGRALFTSEDGNGYVTLGKFMQHMSDSKDTLEVIANNFEKLNSDVNVLRDDVRSLTSMVRLLIQQKPVT